MPNINRLSGRPGAHSMRLSLLLALLGLAASQLENISDFMNDPETNSCLVQISTYLDEFCSQKSSAQQVDEANMFGAHQQIVVALGEAQRHLEHTATLGESSLDTVFWSLDPSDECDRSKLLSMVQSLSDAFQDCDQTSLDYLMIVANFKFASTMSISEIAQERVEFCWQSFVSKVSSQLDRVMGKMSKPVFRNLEQVAAEWTELRSDFRADEQDKAQKPKEMSIRLGEPNSKQVADEDDNDDEYELGNEERPTKFDRMLTRSNEFESVAAALGKINFEQDANLSDLALTFIRLSNKVKSRQRVRVSSLPKKEREKQIDQFFTSFFVEPCQELKDRVKPIVAMGDIYKRHFKQTLGKELSKQKQTNRKLNYELQIYRVCKLGLIKQEQISKKLHSMC